MGHLYRKPAQEKRARTITVASELMLLAKADNDLTAELRQFEDDSSRSEEDEGHLELKIIGPKPA